MGLNQKQLSEILKANAGASGDAWQSAVDQGREAERQKTAQNAALAQLIRGKEIDEQQAISKQQRDLESAKGLRTLLGKDASVRVGEVSMDPRNYEYQRFAQGMADKEADNRRLETAALQGEYNKLSGKSRDQLQALKEIDDLLANPSAVSEGQLRTALARAGGDVGALSEGDIQRTLPRTLGGDVRGAFNYVTGGTGTRLTPEQIKAVQDLVGTKRTAISGRMSGAGNELRTRAPTLAPTLQRSGEIEGVMKGLGVGAGSTADPKTEQMNKIMQRIQELEAKKAGG